MLNPKKSDFFSKIRISFVQPKMTFSDFFIFGILMLRQQALHISIFFKMDILFNQFPGGRGTRKGAFQK